MAEGSLWRATGFSNVHNVKIHSSLTLFLRQKEARVHVADTNETEVVDYPFFSYRERF